MEDLSPFRLNVVNLIWFCIGVEKNSIWFEFVIGQIRNRVVELIRKRIWNRLGLGRGMLREWRLEFELGLDLERLNCRANYHKKLIWACGVAAPCLAWSWCCRANSPEKVFWGLGIGVVTPPNWQSLTFCFFFCLSSLPIAMYDLEQP